ncbi:MAG: endonuclease III [Oscillatoriales cyanobacterium C42_A2020_001]|nr:endonuclease III [Leptolyngbyaceae cyanobacterium C42_A2020_001]
MMQPFDIDLAITHLREAVKPFPQAAMFALADEGFNTLFEQLISCIISIRTYDEVSLPVSRRLFAQARTPDKMSKLSLAKIEELIRESTYANRKAEQIHAIADQIMTEYSGELPQDVTVLLSFKGVGPKCAHLALGVACNLPYVSVDTHVHRVTNRWGYVQTTTPEKTTLALEAKLPQPYWIEINRLLVPFGKHICMGQLPKCSTCPLRHMCQQIGVQRHR